MNKIRNIILGVISSLMTVYPVSAHGQEDKVESRPFVIITTIDSCNNEFLISDNLKLVPQDGKLNITQKDIDVIGQHKLDDVAALGVAYHDIDISGIFEKTIDTVSSGWAVYNIDGTLVSAGFSGEPDFSRLEKNRPYIIKTPGKTFKYIRMK